MVMNYDNDDADGKCVDERCCYLQMFSPLKPAISNNPPGCNFDHDDGYHDIYDGDDGYRDINYDDINIKWIQNMINI